MNADTRRQFQETRGLTLANWLERHNARLIYRPADWDSAGALWNYSNWSTGNQWLELVANGQHDNPSVKPGADADSCGTQACAGGWAVLVFPDLLEFDKTRQHGGENVRPAKALLLECETIEEARLLDKDGVRGVMAACFGMVEPFINAQGEYTDADVEPRHVARDIRLRLHDAKADRTAAARMLDRERRRAELEDILGAEEAAAVKTEEGERLGIHDECKEIGEQDAWEPPPPKAVKFDAGAIGSSGLRANTMPSGDVAWDDPDRHERLIETS